MDAASRERLDSKRRLLQGRLRRRALGQFCDPVMVQMRRANLRAARVSVSEQMAIIRPFTLLPGLDERVDWVRIPHHKRRISSSTGDRRMHLHEALDDLDAEPMDGILVVFHPSFAGIRTRTTDLIAGADPILDGSREVWICSAQGPAWLIESANSEICWKRFAEA